MSSMTDLTERLRERMATAAALPWAINPPGMWWDQGQTYGVPAIGMHDARYYNSAPSKDDAEFIVDAVNALPDLLTTLETLTQENARLREALEKVERWELPATGRFWENVDGTMSDRPMGYEVCYGSNGAREYMRQIARKALGGGDE